MRPLKSRYLVNGQPSKYGKAGGLKSLCENLKLAHFCSARFQAGTLESSRCPPESGHYMNQNRVLTQTLKPAF